MLGAWQLAGGAVGAVAAAADASEAGMVVKSCWSRSSIESGSDLLALAAAQSRRNTDPTVRGRL